MTNIRYAATVHQDRVLKSGHCDDKTKALSSCYLRLIFKECVDSLDKARLEFLQKNGKEGKVKRAETNFQAAKRLSNCYGLELEGFSQRRIKRQYNNMVPGFLTIKP